jgi:hypothetical protein
LGVKGTPSCEPFGRAGGRIYPGRKFYPAAYKWQQFGIKKHIAAVSLLCPIFAIENDEELIMRKGLGLFVALAVVFIMSNFTVQAMPATSSKSLIKSSGQITLVAGGCGRGFHRGPRGRCIPN